MLNFKSPIEWLKEIIKEIVDDYANMAFDWLEIFMLAPTDFSKYPKINELYDIVFMLASTISILFIGWALMNIILNAFAGTQSRSIQEVLFKAFAGFVLAAIAPYLLDKVLLKINNMIVQIFLDKGLETDKLAEFMLIPATAKLSLFLAFAILVLLFVILAFQYIRRLGEYVILLVTSPIAAHSIVTENFEIWSVWWREAISVIFTHAFQVMLLWFIINNLTGTDKLQDYLMAISLMIGLIVAPKYLRQFIYSSGAGRTAVGMAGGSTKMAIYKYAANRMIGK